MSAATRIALLSVGVIGLGEGFLSAILYPDVPMNPVEFAAGLAILGVTFFWYRSDYTLRGYKPSPFLSVGIIAVALLALPYYFFRTRGLKRGALATVCLLLLLFALSLVEHVGAQIALHLGPNNRWRGP